MAGNDGKYGKGGWDHRREQLARIEQREGPMSDEGRDHTAQARALEPNLVATLKQARAWMDRSVGEYLRKRFITGTPLESDLPVWLALFRRHQARGPPVTDPRVQQDVMLFSLLSEADQAITSCEQYLHGLRKSYRRGCRWCRQTATADGRT
jgi:hypothetical protein